MKYNEIKKELESSLKFLSYEINSKQLNPDVLEEINSLLRQALEQAGNDDKEGLLASLKAIESCQPAQFSLTSGVRQHL